MQQEKDMKNHNFLTFLDILTITRERRERAGEKSTLERRHTRSFLRVTDTCTCIQESPIRFGHPVLLPPPQPLSCCSLVETNEFVADGSRS
jgi:hypothetical protein